MVVARMRILLLLNARFPTEKAYGNQAVTMAQGYVAAGHETAIAYPCRSDEVPSPINGVTYVPFGPKIKLRVTWMFHPLRVLGAFAPLRAIRRFRPDVIIANDPFQAGVLSTIFPVVWELHDMPNTDGLARKYFIRRIATHVKAIVSTNHLKLKKLRTVVPVLSPHVVVPNAVTFNPSVYQSIHREEARVKLGISVDETSIVYAGQLFDWKGVDTLIASAAHLPSSSIIHIVGGSGADLARCEGVAARLPQDAARVVFHGIRPKSEIPIWLRAATVVIIPNSGRFEISVIDTSPLKLFEALAAGSAIVASDLPSIREVVGSSEAVLFVRPDDPEALATSISCIASNPSRIDAMRHAAAAFPVLTGVERARRIVEFIERL